MIIEIRKDPSPKTFNLELPALGELHLKREEPSPPPINPQTLEDDVNEDLIRRLISRLKKM